MLNTLLGECGQVQTFKHRSLTEYEGGIDGFHKSSREAQEYLRNLKVNAPLKMEIRFIFLLLPLKFHVTAIV